MFLLVCREKGKGRRREKSGSLGFWIVMQRGGEPGESYKWHCRRE
jgi:hypothetical protein